MCGVVRRRVEVFGDVWWYVHVHDQVVMLFDASGGVWCCLVVAFGDGVWRWWRVLAFGGVQCLRCAGVWW